MVKVHPFREQDFNSLRSQCQKQGKLFEDPVFPAGPGILTFKNQQGQQQQQDQQQQEQNLQDLEWKRPGVGIQICEMIQMPFNN